MNEILNLLLVTLVITNLYLLGSSRIGALIWTVGSQGLLLGVIPLLTDYNHLTWHAVAISVISILVKGVIIPRMLTSAMRGANVRREVEPFIGFALSLAVAILFIGLSFWLGERISQSVPEGIARDLAPVGISMVLCGMFLIGTRKKALTQIIGYLAMENGIYVFGMSLTAEQPFVVELGILLDVFVGVFIMGIALYQISRTFDHIDVDTLEEAEENI